MFVTLPTTGWATAAGTLSNWSTLNPPTAFTLNGTAGFHNIQPTVDLVDQSKGFTLSANITFSTADANVTQLGGFMLRNGATADIFQLYLDARNGTTATSVLHVRKANSGTAGQYQVITTIPVIAKGVIYRLTMTVVGTSMRVRLVDVTANSALLSDTTTEITLPGFAGINRIGVAGYGSPTISNLTLEVPGKALAADSVTLVRATTPTNVSFYFLLQDSMLPAPARPADSPSGTNPPPSPWSTQEPTYTPGATVTLYRVELVVWGDGSFQYGPVQVDSKYEAVKAAYNAAAAAQGTASSALTSANSKNRIVRSDQVAGGAASYQMGDQWWQYSGANIIATWIHDGTIWVSYKMNHQVLGSIDATNITVGVLNGAILAARSATIDKLLITSLENLVQDASFEANTSLAWNLTAPTTNSTTNPRTGARALSMATQAAGYVGAQSAQSVRVEAGEKYRVGMWIRRGAGTSGLNPVAIRFLTGETEASTPSVDADVLLGASAGATSYTEVGTTYVRVSGVWTVPANAKYARADIVVRDTTASQVYHVDDFEMFKMSQGELIVDGAIDGKVITGATVQTLQAANRGVKLDSFGLRAWDAAGNETVSISSATGAATFSGEFRSKTAQQELWLHSDGEATGSGTTEVTRGTGYLDMTPAAGLIPRAAGGITLESTATGSSIDIDGAQGQSYLRLRPAWVQGRGPALATNPVGGAALQLTNTNNNIGRSSRATLEANHTVRLRAGESSYVESAEVVTTSRFGSSSAGGSGSKIQLFADRVELFGEGMFTTGPQLVVSETDWVDITTFATGWSGASGVNRPRVRRQGNRVEMYGAIVRSGTTGTGTNMITIPVGFRATATTGSMIIGHVNTNSGFTLQLRYSMAANGISLDGSYQNPSGTIGSGVIIPMNASWYIDGN